jgi:hypothetical protein
LFERNDHIQSNAGFDLASARFGARFRYRLRLRMEASAPDFVGMAD